MVLQGHFVDAIGTDKLIDLPAEPVALVDALLKAAMERRASDVHFQPIRDALRIRLRVDGLLQDVRCVGPELGRSAVNRLKVMAGLLSYRSDLPQEGRIGLREAPEEVREVRVSSFPTVEAEQAVVRILYDDASLRDLDRLGLPEAVSSELNRFCLARQGMLLMTGPAGSGKSTTLCAMLRRILELRPGVSVMSLEDPVERRIDGVSQVQIAPGAEMTFPVALRSLLRQDPEVLMIGEIRDTQTAAIAVEASLTGHLLLTTLHSGSCVEALVRLTQMGIDRCQITSSVLGVVNQRLLRTLCPSCGLSPQGPGRPVGCPNCLNTGYLGRVAIGEMVPMFDELAEDLRRGRDTRLLRQTVAQSGHASLAQMAAWLVGQGRTTTEEVRRVCPDVNEGEKKQAGKR
jgi:general secretion pathway protein E